MVRRGWLLWLLAAAAVILGSVTALVGALGWSHWKWLAAAAVAVGAVVGLVAKLLSKRLEAQVEDGYGRRDALADSAVGGGRVQVRDIGDGTRVRVHPAVLPAGVAELATGTSRLPPYARRDQHDAVVKRLVPGSFVLIEGDSGAGKTRLAFEAIREMLPKHVLFAPEPSALGAAVKQMRHTRKAVLWLDDLERYLEADVLNATVIHELLAGDKHRRVVVATLRHLARDEVLTTTNSDSEVVDRRRRILEVAEAVPITRRFTTTELDRARTLTHDPRITDALTHADQYGLAEYLAAGPQLLREWSKGKESCPRGAALVTAAIDCRRGGFISPLPRELLTEVHTHYLPTDPRTRIEDLDKAWRWATERWENTTAMLEPTNTNIAADTVIVFDYLVDHTQRTTPVDNDPPQPVLEKALEYADGITATAIGNHAYQRGRYHLALIAYQHVLTRYSDPDDPDRLGNRGNLALVLQDLGRLGEAEAEHRAIFAAMTRVLGPDHPHTLRSRGNLAIVLQMLGRLGEAEAEQRAVLDARTRVLGPDDRNTLSSRGNLALVLQNLGRLGEAEAEQRAVLDARIRVLGPDDHHTLGSRGNLALVLRELGRWEEAEAEQRAVVEAMTQMLGSDHPDTLGNRNNLALMLQDLGRLGEAEVEHRAVLEAMTRMLGADHPNTLSSRGNLANVLQALGQPEEAEVEHRAVLEAMTQMLGSDHPDTLSSRGNLALALRDLGRLGEAEVEQHAVLDARTRMLGADHPTTLSSRGNLALILQDLGRLDEAETEQRAVLEAMTRILGADHPNTLSSRKNLANVLLNLGRLSEANGIRSRHKPEPAADEA